MAFLEPGHVYDRLEEAVTAATCLCHLHPAGATVYGTTDLREALTISGEAYIVATKAVQVGGARWAVPAAPYEPIYTITKAKGAR